MMMMMMMMMLVIIIIHKIPVQQKRKARYQGSTEYSYIGHSTHTLREVLILKYKTFNVGNSITCSINCNYRTAATLYTL
jgi:hypothetical protein